MNRSWISQKVVLQVLIWIGLVWQIMDDLPSTPNLPLAKLSHYYNNLCMLMNIYLATLNKEIK